MEKVIPWNKLNHLAGIVPVAAPPLDFNMPWDDALIPIAKDYLAVERAVYECLLAGCDSIWVTCHYGTQPLIRKRIGDFVRLPLDPKGTREQEKRKVINIFYVPIHPRDREKRDSLGYSVLYGADSAFRVCSFISKWAAPDRYYCAFPYGVTGHEFIRENVLKIKSTSKVLFSHEGKTVKDGIHASFTFDAEDYKKCRDYIKKYTIRHWKERTPEEREQKKPIHLSIGEIFSNLETQNSKIIEYPWFYNISSWDEYREYLKSGIVLERNKNSFIKATRKETYDL